ncbi:MAG: xanthine dehydrogenase family protein molybdopterin-binding subunit [Rhodospirillaceae bacterium]|nr:xanthine dehydrogenase family protein molybdopterin-binding subunit [Rhodospirillaceae bacterium]
MTRPLTALPVDMAASRRALLAGAGALMVGFVFGRGARAAVASDAVLAPNAFVRVDADSMVTVIIKHLEMGQGVYTGLATIVAEELDADWSQVQVETAPADASRYGSPIQMTGGSGSIRGSYTPLRQAGATARAMLVEAAAQAWRVPAGEITVEKGIISHAASARSAPFGAFAAAAAKLPVPAEVPLKDPGRFTLIGTRLPRLDVPVKTDGSAQFGADVVLPGMVHAAVAHPPRFGATVATVDDAVARVMPGVIAVAVIPSGVAVVAQTFWQAMRARDALTVTWDDAAAEMRGTDRLLAEYQALAETPGVVARGEGDVEAALAGAARIVEATFDFPYLAHAPMEPLNAVVRFTGDACEVWAGCQFQTVDQGNVARVLGLAPPQVQIHTLMSGGSFGRRATAVSDYMVEAAHIAKALPPGTPVKLQWTREDDTRGGFYRPMFHHRVKAGLDAQGKIVAWSHRVVGQSLLKGTPFGAQVEKLGYDPSQVEGLENMPYEVPNVRVDVHTPDVKVPVLWWRSVGNTQNIFALETFIDRLARAANADPLAFRLSMLSDHPRHRAVLELAAEKAGWGTPLPPGRARGLAVAESFASYVAEVAEVSRGPDGRIKVERVVCAVDCGTAINPNIVAAQMEGGIAYGLSAVLSGAITLDGGVVQQANFDTYRVLRMADMPEVEVHIVPSTAPPTGVGEPGVPPIGPAVANAIAALTGREIDRLPLSSALAV